MKLHEIHYRFIISGGLNTIFGWLLFSILYKFFDFNEFKSLFISMLAGIFFNFLTYGGYAFKVLKFKVLPKFVAAYVILYMLNLILLKIISLYCGDVTIGQLLISPLLAIISFYMMSKCVFN
jgi:putative flippase GtrA